MPTILALETATKSCSVALLRDGGVPVLRELESEQHVHAEKVNVFIAEVMQEAGLAFKDLDAVAVGIGPGSYTGLRIGLSAAKGLCFALRIPIIGISTLHTLFASARARHPSMKGTCWPMIDARRMEVFTQSFGPDGVVLTDTAPLVVESAWATSAGQATVFGDGADKAAEVWAVAPRIIHLPGIRPSAGAMGPEAMGRFTHGSFDDLAYLVPEYGKAANVAQPKKFR